MKFDKDKDTLRRMMGEVATLPPEDPARREVETAVAQEGTWAEKEWLSLLQEDERLRLELRRVDAPSTLKAKLLAIPVDSDRLQVRPRRMVSWRSLLWTGGLAAAAVILALLMGRGPSDDVTINEIALLAMDNHLADQHVTIETTDPQILAASFSNVFHFPVKTPRLGEGLRLVGGRHCTLDENPVMYTLWQGKSGNYSLYQFCPSDFSLPATWPRRVILPEQSDAKGQPCEVLMWTDKGCAYALVADRGSALNRLSPQLRDDI